MSSLKSWIVIWYVECYINSLKWHIHWKLHCCLQQILIYTKHPLAKDSLWEAKQNYSLVARGPISPEYHLSYKPHVYLWYPLHHWKKPNVCNLGNGCNFCCESILQGEIVMVASWFWSVGLKIELLNKNIVGPSFLSEFLTLFWLSCFMEELFPSLPFLLSFSLFFPSLCVGRNRLKALLSKSGSLELKVTRLKI